MFARRRRGARTPKRASYPFRPLRSEQLEPRALLTTVSPLGGAILSSGLPRFSDGPVAPPAVAEAACVAADSGPISGTTALIAVLGSDAGGEDKLVYDWSVAGAPAGGSASFCLNGTNEAKNNAVTFTAAGVYDIAAKIVNPAGLSVVSSLEITVAQTLTRIVVTPGTAALQAGGTQQFAAEGFDQFQQAMAVQPAFTWVAGGGTITADGLFTAPAAGGGYSIAAQSGVVGGGAPVSVAAPNPPPSPAPNPPPSQPTVGLQDPALAGLVAKLDADGSLDRDDMIQILSAAGGGGTVSAADFADLKTILAHAAEYNMPDYVQVLAGDVVNGNPANAHYQGAPLGNLAAGSSAAQWNELIDKWFLGTDLPALNSTEYVYTTASGLLFPAAPSHNDEYQGLLGDCYFISALGTIADTNPAAIENMFIDNGDGTFTVRFYTGEYGQSLNADGSTNDGFAGGASTADYVTVNRSLAAYSNGMLVYADYGLNASDPANPLWIPLAEKAYAQWNETGNAGRDGQNAFSSIEGGWMATVNAQVLGHNATDYNVTASGLQAMEAALAAGKAVTIATNAGTLPCNLVGSHAYAVIAVDPSAGLFTLYNPWGCDQPGVVTWSQIEATCCAFVVADSTGSTPVTAAQPGAAAVDAVLASFTSRL